MVEYWGQERDHPNPTMWVGSSSTLLHTLPPAPKQGTGSQGHLLSPEWCRERQAPKHRGLLCPSLRHRQPMVCTRLQVGSKLLLKPSTRCRAWAVTIVWPQQPFVSGRLLLVPGPDLP